MKHSRFRVAGDFFAVGLLAHFLLAAVGHCQESDLLKLPPPGAVVIAHYSGSEQLTPAYEKSALGQIFNDPQMQTFLKKPKEWLIQKLASQPSAFGGETTKQIVNWLVPKESVLALYFGESRVDSVWCVRLGKDTEASRKTLDEVMAADKGVTERKSGTHIVKVGGPSKGEVAMAQQTFVMASQSDLMDQVLARLDGAAQPGGGSRTTPVLAVGQTIGWITVDVPELLKRIRGEMKNEPDIEFDGFISALGVNGVGRIEIAAGFDGPAIRFVGRTALTKLPSGLLEWFAAPPPLDEKALKLIPKDVDSALVSRMDVPAVWNSIMAAIAEGTTPERFQESQNSIAETDEQLQFKFKDDLIDSLGDTIAFYSKPSAGLMQMGEMAIIISLKDGGKVSSCVDRLTDHAQKQMAAPGASGQVSIKSSDVGGRRVYYLAGLPMFSPAWTVKGNYAYVANSSQALNSVMAQVESPQSSLADNVDFQKSRKMLPEKVVLVSYEDTRQSVAGLYGTLGMIVAMMAGAANSPIDLTLLPPIASIQSKVFGAVGVVTADKQSISLQGYSPFGVSSVGSVTGAGIGVGLALPAVQGARERAQCAACASNLKQIGLARHLYASDNNEKFPDKLMDLFPKYATSKKIFICPSTQAKEGAVTYVYVKGLKAAGKDGDKMILAYDADGNHKDERQVLFVDGHVVAMKEEAFQEALAKQENPQEKSAAPATKEK